MVPNRMTRVPLVRRRAFGQTAALAAVNRAAEAQPRTVDWPTRPVRYIDLFPPGSGTDGASRAWCATMSEATGQQFVVENRSGAGGTLGTTAIARSTPDGYTIGQAGTGQLAIAPTISPGLGYSPARDFTYISGLWRVPLLLLVNNNLPARSVAEFVDLLKRNPRRYQYGTGGIGTSPHLAAELFKQRAGVEIEHVPYRGAPPALLDLIAGRIGMVWTIYSAAIGSVRDGQVRALAVTSPRRSAELSDVPALAEFLPGFDMVSWTVLLGPAGIAPAMVERMHQLATQALQRPLLIERFRQAGNTPWIASPQEIAAYRAEQEALLAPVVRASGARIE